MRLLPLLVAFLLAAGCTRVVEGTPTAPTGVLLPPRPREVRLDGVDPCSLLTAEQRAGLGLDSYPKLSRPYVRLFKGQVATCTTSGPSPQGFLLVSGAVTTAGVERWSENDVAAKIHSTVIAGFPAVTAVPAKFADYCNVEVDVAEGQLLDVQFGSGDPSFPISQEDLCGRAARSAELMMTSLLAR